MMLNEQLHEDIIGTHDLGIPSVPGNDNYEADAKKDKEAVAGSTTVSSDFKEPHVLRANRFGFNFNKFTNKRKLKVVVVTEATQKTIIPGLTDFIKAEAAKNEKNVDTSKAIFAVFVEVSDDGSYELVNEAGKPLTAEQKKDAVNHAIFQPFPLETLQANYKSQGRGSMFRDDVSDADVLIIKQKYAAWRIRQLAATGLSDPQTMLPSYGIPVYQQKEYVPTLIK